ncbi:MAG: type III secretion system translocon subunit SctB [Candidatus Adiutrix sp.]|jgi:hypothetical protein|nr:type III secretion system translocon subunit SctB [Candidatus Adiutrix sp.]
MSMNTIRLVDPGAKLDASQFQALQGRLEQLYAAKGGRLSQTDFKNFLETNQLSPQNFTFNVTPALARPAADFDPALLAGQGLSPGAAVMALITQDAAEQRKVNKELIAAQTQETVAAINKQAEEMREKAVTQLVCAIVSGVVSIAGSVAALGTGAKLGFKADGTAAVMNSIQSGVKGTADIIQAGGQFAGTMADARIKELEAKTERLRSDRDTLKDFNSAWTELIQKSLSAGEAIQQGLNQARAKILG